MHPILFQVGVFKVYSYGFMAAFGFLTAVCLAGLEAKKRGVSSENIFDIYLYAMIFGIIGARLLHVALEFGHYSTHPLDIIMLNRGGLAFQGGLAGGILAAFFTIKKRGLPALSTADMIIPYVALAQSIGRIGCILNGCCYGVPSNSYLAVYSDEFGRTLQPTQFYLSIFFLLVFVFLKLKYEEGEDRKRLSSSAGRSRAAGAAGSVFAWYLLIFSIGSFFIDFLRGDIAPVLFGLKASQLISLAIFSVSISMFGALKWKTIHSR